MVCPLQRQKKEKYSKYSVNGKKWYFEVCVCGYVSVFVCVCVCDHLVTFSGYLVRECVWGLVGLGGCEFMCVEVCVTGCACGCAYMGACRHESVRAAMRVAMHVATTQRGTGLRKDSLRETCI